jgi:hypothetical protein
MGLNNQWQSGQTVGPADLNAMANYIMGANSAGPYASRPPAGNLGNQYYCTDCDAMYLDNGTAWVKVRLGGAGGPPMADPPATGWTALNFGTSTWAQSLDGMLMTCVPPASTTIAYQYRAYPTPPFTLTVELECDLSTPQDIPGASQYIQSGIFISDGTKYYGFGPLNSNFAQTAPWYASGWAIAGQSWASATVGNTTFQGWFPPLAWAGGMPKWYRFTDDNTNMYFYWSINGIDWHLYYQTARLAYLAAPTRIGLGHWNTVAGVNGLMRLRSWSGVA